MAALATSEQRRSLDSLMAEAERRGRFENLRNLGLAVAFLALVAFTYNQTEVSPDKFARGAFNMGRMLAGFLHPSWDLIRPGSEASLGHPEGLIEHFVLETLYIAVIGTFFGTVVAIPVSFLAARNLMRRNLLGTGVYFSVRTAMSVIRSVPTLFWGLLFVTAISVGPFPGVLAVSIFSFGLMSKLFSEAIEAIDWGQVEALMATGANPFQVVVHGVLPQVTPYMIAHLLYTFEVNVHSATVLGIIGAGGIGFLLFQFIETFDYPATAVLLLVVVPMTMIIDYSSAAIRNRIIYGS